MNKKYESRDFCCPVPAIPRLVTLRERVQQKQNYRLRLCLNNYNGLPSERKIIANASVDPIHPQKQRGTHCDRSASCPFEIGPVSLRHAVGGWVGCGNWI